MRKRHRTRHRFYQQETQFYANNPLFSSLQFLDIKDDKAFLDYMRQNNFDVNALWCNANPVTHCFLANESFSVFKRLLRLIPDAINPNLCDGEPYGKKSILILLSMMPSSGSLALQFLEQYQHRLNLDYQDTQGKTALHYAVILGRHELVQRLLACGASRNIVDNDGLTAHDYLSCSPAIITAVLANIDIEPTRDINAIKNSIASPEGMILTIKGQQLVQNKAAIKSLLSEQKLSLKVCIEGHLYDNIGTFIVDDSKESFDKIHQLAKQIAAHLGLSVEEVFVNKPLAEERMQQLVEELDLLFDNFSGISVLEQCMEGHQHVARILGPVEQSTQKPAP